MVMVSKKIIFWYMHCFTNFHMWDNLTTNQWPNVIKGRGTNELEQFKSLSSKMQEAMLKSLVIAEKKEKQYVRQIICTNQGHLPTKVTPVIYFTHEPVIQWDVPVAENTFVDDCK